MYITKKGTIVIHPHIYSVTGQQVKDLDENIDIVNMFTSVGWVLVMM